MQDKGKKYAKRKVLSDRWEQNDGQGNANKWQLSNEQVGTR